MLKQLGNDHFYVTSTWNTRGVFVGKKVFKATLSLNIACSQDAEEFIQGYCDYNSEAIKVSYTRYGVYLH